MCPHMQRQVRILYETLPTYGAHVRFLASVGAVVGVAGRLVTETFITILAGVRLAVGVDEAMRGEEATGREGLPAYIALPGAEPYVTGHVGCQQTTLTVPLVTHGAGVFLLNQFASVHPRVSLQCVQLTECLVTHGTRIALRLHMP